MNDYVKLLEDTLAESRAHSSMFDDTLNEGLFRKAKKALGMDVSKNFLNNELKPFVSKGWVYSKKESGYWPLHDSTLIVLKNKKFPDNMIEIGIAGDKVLHIRTIDMVTNPNAYTDIKGYDFKEPVNVQKIESDIKKHNDNLVRTNKVDALKKHAKLGTK